VEKITKEI